MKNALVGFIFIINSIIGFTFSLILSNIVTNILFNILVLLNLYSIYSTDRENIIPNIIIITIFFLLFEILNYYWSFNVKVELINAKLNREKTPYLKSSYFNIIIFCLSIIILAISFLMVLTYNRGTDSEGWGILVIASLGYISISILLCISIIHTIVKFIKLQNKFSKLPYKKLLFRNK